MTLDELFTPVLQVFTYFANMFNSVFPPLIIDLIFIPVALIAVYAIARYFISVFHK